MTPSRRWPCATWKLRASRLHTHALSSSACCSRHGILPVMRRSGNAATEVFLESYARTHMPSMGQMAMSSITRARSKTSASRSRRKKGCISSHTPSNKPGHDHAVRHAGQRGIRQSQIHPGHGLPAGRGHWSQPHLLKSGETAPAEYPRLWQTISSGGEWRGEFHNRKKNGELFWEAASISAITDPTGRITHYLAVKEDITTRKPWKPRSASNMPW